MEYPSFGYLILKTAGVLIFLILCMVLLVFFMRKYFPKFIGRYGSGNHIKIIERCVLSPKHSIVLVEIDGVRFVVGIGPQNIVFMEGTLLQPTILQDAEEIEAKS